MKVEAFVFDLDGTLLNTLEDLTDSANYALAYCGFPTHGPDEIRSYIGNGIVKLMERACPANTEPNDIEKALAAFRRHYRENCVSCTKAYPNVADTLAALGEMGFKIGVLSNKSHYETVRLVEHFFGSIVEYAQGSMEEFPKKPRPEGLFHVLSCLGVRRENAVYVGDSGVDVETAANAGISCIGVAWGFRGREALTAAGADTIINDPMELLDIAGSYEPLRY
ncbi:MAG: HAD-IA family hydrolase [Bacillota bacterium]|nr:HAD-IA family hydrolase [Bacillota bacterium]